MRPGKRKAPEDTGADATTRADQPESYPDEPTLASVISKYNGKVRPAPREPERTHYGCSCCRRSA